MTSEILLYVVEDLYSAREFLKTYQKPIELLNIKGSTRYYGILTLDYIFKTLQAEFPQIVKVTMDVDTDNAALFTAMKLRLNYLQSFQ